MIELYHASMSVCSEKVRMALAEKGLEFKSHFMNLREGHQQTPDYIKLNPNAVVPTLVHDGNVIIEFGCHQRVHRRGLPRNAPDDIKSGVAGAHACMVEAT